SFIIIGASAGIRDIYKKALGRTLTEKQELLSLRILTGLILVFAMVLSLNPPQLIILLGATAWGMFSASFGPAVILGLRWKRATKEAALIAMVLGIAVAGVGGILNATALSQSPILAGWNLAGLSALTGFVVMIVVSLLTPARESEMFRHFRRPLPRGLAPALASGVAGSSASGTERG
ncbi:MAG: sodium:solute symporter family transporter, partial [Anaerolineae bacterium]